MNKFLRQFHYYWRLAQHMQTTMEEGEAMVTGGLARP